LGGADSVIQYQCGYKYQLYSEAKIALPAPFCRYDTETPFISINNGYLILKAGYAWDGPSGPTLDSKDFMRGSLIHDAIYQLMREGYIPPECKDAADQLLVSICKADGMGKIRCWYVYQAVKRFGLDATIQNRDILCAP
jgi:hypothetical protein